MKKVNATIKLFSTAIIITMIGLASNQVSAAAAVSGNSGVNEWAQASLAKLLKSQEQSTSAISPFPPDIMGGNYLMPDYQSDKNKADLNLAMQALINVDVEVVIAPCVAGGNACGGYQETQSDGKSSLVVIDPNMSASNQMFVATHEYNHHVMSTTDSPLDMTIFGVNTGVALYDERGWLLQEPLAYLSEMAAAGSIIANAPAKDLPDVIATMLDHENTMNTLNTEASKALESTYNAINVAAVRDQIIYSENGLNATIANGTNLGFTQAPDLGGVPSEEVIMYHGDPVTGQGDLISFKCPGCDLTTPEGRAEMYDRFLDKVARSLDLLSEFSPTSAYAVNIKAQNDAAIAAAKDAAANWGQTCGFNCGVNSVIPILATPGITYTDKLNALTSQSSSLIDSAIVANNAAKNVTCTFNGKVLTPGQSITGYKFSRYSTAYGVCQDVSSVLTCGTDGKLPGSEFYTFSSCVQFTPRYSGMIP